MFYERKGADFFKKENMYKESLQGLLQFNVMPDGLFFSNPFLWIEVTLFLFQLLEFFFGQ